MHEQHGRRRTRAFVDMRYAQATHFRVVRRIGEVRKVCEAGFGGAQDACRRRWQCWFHIPPKVARGHIALYVQVSDHTTGSGGTQLLPVATSDNVSVWFRTHVQTLCSARLAAVLFHGQDA